MTPAQRVAVVGGGHNGLVAAAYLAQAGLEVTVLERLDSVGGAAVSTQAFEGVDARLSRYSYLVSLLPARIIRELRLDIRLTRRRYSSFTPEPGSSRALLIDHGDPRATADSFAGIGATADASAWTDFYEGTTTLARSLFPTVCDPLLTRHEARRALGNDALWAALIEEPIGHHIESSFENDLVRGVAFTDALIGTFAPAHDETLAANRCFVYHVIGNGTGDWDVPVGGMGSVSGALESAARTSGATIITGADVTSITPDGEVGYRRGGIEHTAGFDVVLSGVAPHVLARLFGEEPPARPEGEIMLAPACLQITVCDRPCCPGPWISTMSSYFTPPSNSDHSTPLAMGVTNPAISGVTPAGTLCTMEFHGRKTYCAKPPQRCGAFSVDV